MLTSRVVEGEVCNSHILAVPRDDAVIALISSALHQNHVCSHKYSLPVVRRFVHKLVPLLARQARGQAASLDSGASSSHAVMIQLVAASNAPQLIPQDMLPRLPICNFSEAVTASVHCQDASK